MLRQGRCRRLSQKIRSRIGRQPSSTSQIDPRLTAGGFGSNSEYARLAALTKAPHSSLRRIQRNWRSRSIPATAATCTDTSLRDRTFRRNPDRNGTFLPAWTGQRQHRDRGQFQPAGCATCRTRRFVRRRRMEYRSEGRAKRPTAPRRNLLPAGRTSQDGLRTGDVIPHLHSAIRNPKSKIQNYISSQHPGGMGPPCLLIRQTSPRLTVPFVGSYIGG